MADSLLLVADVGNTRIKFALLRKGRAVTSGLPECLKTWITPQTETLDWTTIQNLAESTGLKLSQALIAGSQRERIHQLEAEWPASLPELRVIRSAQELPIKLLLDVPEKVGVDRVLNAVAVNCLRQPDSPAVIVDAGTAITIDAVSAAGEFLGGAILPGYELEAQALHHYTSLLPLIPMAEIIGQTPRVIGRNTLEALRSGLIWGQVGAVNEIVSRMTEQICQHSAALPNYFLTGGAAPLLEAHLLKKFRVYPQLTLQGLGCLNDSP